MAHDGKGNVRYKINGEFVYLPKRTKAEQIEARKVYMKAWIKENPDKVQANLKKHRAHIEKIMREYKWKQFIT